MTAGSRRARTPNAPPWPGSRRTCPGSPRPPSTATCPASRRAALTAYSTSQARTTVTESAAALEQIGQEKALRDRLPAKVTGLEGHVRADARKRAAAEQVERAEAEAAPAAGRARRGHRPSPGIPPPSHRITRDPGGPRLGGR